MLAVLLLGVAHDRRLLREARVNISSRWCISHRLEERLPDHSSLTRIRQCWGETRFTEIFQRTVRSCLDVKVAKGEVAHVDASLIRADVSWKSLVECHVEEMMAEHPLGEKAGKAEGWRRPPWRWFGESEPDGPGRASGEIGGRGVAGTRQYEDTVLPDGCVGMSDSLCEQRPWAFGLSWLSWLSQLGDPRTEWQTVPSQRPVNRAAPADDSEEVRGEVGGF